MYTTGDVEGAVKLFLGLLKGTSSGSPSLSLPGPAMGLNGVVAAPLAQEAQVNLDKVFLEDFRVAFAVSQPLGILRLMLSCLVPCVALDGYRGWEDRSDDLPPPHHILYTQVNQVATQR